MKKYLFFLAAIAAVSCSDSDDLDSTTQNDDGQGGGTDPQEVTSLSFVASTSPLTRVDVTEDGDDWAVAWNEDDALGGWALDSSVTEQVEYTIVDDSVDGDDATFTGSIPTGATSMRFVHPYDSSLSKSDNKITLSLASQSVGSDFSHLSSTTYMISQSIDDLTVEDQGTLSMSHIGAAVELQISFESSSFDEADYTISSVVLGGDDLALPLTGELDLTDGTFAAATSGKMTIEADNIEAVSGVYYIRFNTFPIASASGSTLDVEVTLSDGNGTSYTSTAAITAGDDFVASTKNTIVAAISDPVEIEVLTLEFLLDECDLTAPKPLIKWTDLGEDWVYTLSSQTWYEGDDAATSNWSQYFGCKEYAGTEFEIPLSLISGDIVKGQSAMPIFYVTLKGINTVTGENINTAGYPGVDDGTENLIFSPQVQGTFVDTRGDEVIEYDWVRLGTTVWMTETLKTTRTVSGEPLTSIAGQDYLLGDASSWVDPSLGLLYDIAPLSFFDSSITAANTFTSYDFFQHGDAEANQEWFLENAGGHVYNAVAALSDEVLPAGWHTMTNEDTEYMGTYTSQSMVSNMKFAIESDTALKLLDDVTFGSDPTNDYGLSFTPTVVRYAAYEDDYYGFRGGDWQSLGNYWNINQETIDQYIENPRLASSTSDGVTTIYDAGSIQNTFIEEERMQVANRKIYTAQKYVYLARWNVSNLYCIRCVMTDDE